MATDVYRIVTAEGHEYDYHGTVEQLKDAHPGAQITGRRVMNELGEGSHEPYSIAKAQAATRKEKAASDAPAEKPAAREEKPAKRTAATPPENVVAALDADKAKGEKQS